MSLSTATTIAVILPPRERFRAADAGAVALTVHDFVRASRFRERIAVLGGETEPFPNIDFVHVPTTMSWMLGKNLAYAQTCITLLRLSKVQLVEVHNRMPLALRIKKALPTLQVAIHVHNDPHGMDGAKTAAQRQQLIERLDVIYCVSAYVRQRLLEGVAPELAAKVRVVYNALIAAPIVVPELKQPWLVYAGRFIPEKGVLQLAQALAEVLPKFPQWRAVFLGAWGFGHVAGRSDYEQQVYAALATVSEQVEFRGHVSQAEVIETLLKTSVAVIPSTCGEAFGRVALEAMLTGNAVVVSAFGALPEIAGEAAVILRDVSKESLVQQLSTLLADTSGIATIAERCQQRAIQTFSLSQQVGVLDDIRQQLIQE